MINVDILVFQWRALICCIQFKNCFKVFRVAQGKILLQANFKGNYRVAVLESKYNVWT